MEYRNIQEFIVLARCLNFSEAAVQLNMTQSNLSKHIQQMEKELGSRLFNRTSRSVTLSPFGEYYLPFAEQIMDSFHSAAVAVKAYSDKRTNLIRITVVHNPQNYKVNAAIKAFHKEYPDCLVQMIETNENEATKMVAEKEINLFATYCEEHETLPCGFVPVGQSHVVAILPKDHPLSGKSQISLSDLKGEPLILPRHNTKISQMILDTLASENQGALPDILFEGGSTACIDLVRSGMGISLHLKEIIRLTDEHDICSVEISPHINYRYGLGYATDRPLSAAEQNFVTYIKQNWQLA